MVFKPIKLYIGCVVIILLNQLFVTSVGQNFSNVYCHCYIWPDCLAQNCSHSIFSDIRARQRIDDNRNRLSRLPRPFTLFLPVNNTINNLKREIIISLPFADQVRVSLEQSRQTLEKTQKIYRNNIVNTEKLTAVSFLREPDDRLTIYKSTDYPNYNYVGEAQVISPAKDSLSDKIGTVSMEIRHAINGLLTMDEESYYSIGLLNCPECSDDLLIHYSHVNDPVQVRMDKRLHRFWQPLPLVSKDPIKSDVLELPVSLIIDYGLFSLLGSNITASINYISATFNQAKLLFANTKIEPILVQIEVWNIMDRFTVSSSIKTTLNNFAEYQIHERPKQTSSIGRVHIFLTQKKFNESSDYLSVPSSICTPRSLSVIRVNEYDTMFHTARTISLSIRDIFGLHSLMESHGKNCDERTVFNSCDKNLFNMALLLGTGSCLVDKSSASVVDTCGNGWIDFGEECDIGHGSHDEFPCCNPKTCLADVNSVCVTGGCCHKCQVAAKGSMCRNATDHCDIPEFCSGRSNECPENLHLENGHPCQTKLDPLQSDNREFRSQFALCFNGHCPTPVTQCKNHWGPTAREASNKCYEQFNVKTKSACGVDGQVCREENVLCGMLHCEGGTSPQHHKSKGSSRTFVTQTNYQNQSVQCKYAEDVYVLEGSSCGRGKYCFLNQCSYPDISFTSKCPTGSPYSIVSSSQDRLEEIYSQTLEEQVKSLAMLPLNFLPQRVLDNNRVFPKTQLSCSGRGLCTNVGFCFCQPGWFGPECQSTDPDDIQPFFAHLTPEDVEQIWYSYKYPDYSSFFDANMSNHFLFGFHFLIILSVFSILFILFVMLLTHFLRKKRKSTNFLGLRSKKNPLTGKVISTADVDLSLYPQSHRSSSSKGDERKKGKKTRSKSKGNDDYLMGDASEESLKNTKGIVNPGANVNSNSGTDPEANSSIERIIKFGNMPSYKHEKQRSSTQNLQCSDQNPSLGKHNISVSPLSVELSPNLSSFSNKYYTETPLAICNNKNVSCNPATPISDGNSDHYENHMTLLMSTQQQMNPLDETNGKRATLQGMKGILKNKPTIMEECNNLVGPANLENGIKEKTCKKKKLKKSKSSNVSSSTSSASSSSNNESDSSDDSSSSSSSNSSSNQISKSKDKTQQHLLLTSNNNHLGNNSALNNAHMIANGQLDRNTNNFPRYEELEVSQNFRPTPVTQRPLPAQPTSFVENGNSFKPHLNYQQTQNPGYFIDHSEMSRLQSNGNSYLQTIPNCYSINNIIPQVSQKNHISSSASSSSGIQSRENTMNNNNNAANNNHGNPAMMYPNSVVMFNKSTLPPTPINCQKVKNNNNIAPSVNEKGNIDLQNPAYSSVDSGTGMNYQYPTQSQLLYSQYQRNHNYPLFEMSDGYETYYQPPCEITSSQNLDKNVNSNQSLSCSIQANVNNTGLLTNTSNLSNSSASQNNYNSSNQNKLVSAYAVHGSLSTNGSHDEGMLSLDESSNHNNTPGDMGQSNRLDVIYQEL